MGGVRGVGDEGPRTARLAGKVKLPGLVPGVEKEQKRVAGTASVDEHGEGARLLGLPVDRFLGLAVGTEPADVGKPVFLERLTVEERSPPQDGKLAPQGEQAFHETAKGACFRGFLPAEPAQFTVLAIAVVVAALGAQLLVSGE